MEQDTAATAIRKDSDDEQNAHDSSTTTGEKADEDQQILMDTRDTNWYKSTQALKYLQPVFMPIVKDKMKSLQLQSMADFGRQLCAEATADDIILGNGRLAHFKHVCPGTVVACQNLLNIIKGHTSDSVNFYQMLKGTDPQHWLKSPFEYVRLFLKDWMRCDIHDFQECDITALCTIVKRCKPLMQIFDERKIDELRTGDVRLLHSMVVRLIQGWLPGARLVYEHKCDQAKNQLQDIIYMENKLAKLSSGQDITPLKQSAEYKFGAKLEQLTDESQTLKQTTEELAKVKEEKRELEKQIEELRKLRQEERRVSEKRTKKLKERLEAHESRPKEKSTQRSTGDKGETVQKRRPIWSWVTDFLPFSGRISSGLFQTVASLRFSDIICLETVRSGALTGNWLFR